MQAVQMRARCIRQATVRSVPTSQCQLSGYSKFTTRKMLMGRLAATEADAAAAVDEDREYSNFDALSELVKFVNDSDIELLEMKHSGFTISMKKKAALQPVQPTYVQAPAAPAVAAAPAPAPAAPAPAAPAPAPAAAPAPKAAPPKIEGVEVTSPMSGTFYRSPAPGEPYFVKEGDRVTKGQTVGIIEAMKLMNEIEAEVSGEVVKFLVDSGNSISPGQPLLIIKP